MRNYCSRFVKKFVKKIMCLIFLCILSDPAGGVDCAPGQCPNPIDARVVGGAPQYDADDKRIDFPIPGAGNWDVRIRNNASWPVSICGSSMAPDFSGEGINYTLPDLPPGPLAGFGAQNTQWGIAATAAGQPGLRSHDFKVCYFYVHPTLHCDCSGWASVDPISNAYRSTMPVPVGYNTPWLIFSAIFLMLAGGYLILRRVVQKS